MKKSLGNKRNELSDAHIAEITQLYAAGKHEAKSKFVSNGEAMERVCSKVFDNREFGYLKLTIERPLRLNFQTSNERIMRLREASAFKVLAESKKRKDKAEVEAEEAAGRVLQESIVLALVRMDETKLYKNRAAFEADLIDALKTSELRLPTALRRVIVSALSERDPEADICTDANGNPEPDPELRDTESVPLPDDIALPLPIDYDDKADNTKLVALVHEHCDAYFVNEVAPHWPDAWIDYSKTKVGYEIPINRHFYVYEAPRKLAEIERDIKTLEGEILQMLKELV